MRELIYLTITYARFTTKYLDLSYDGAILTHTCSPTHCLPSLGSKKSTQPATLPDCLSIHFSTRQPPLPPPKTRSGLVVPFPQRSIAFEVVPIYITKRVPRYSSAARPKPRRNSSLSHTIRYIFFCFGWLGTNKQLEGKNFNWKRKQPASSSEEWDGTTNGSIWALFVCLFVWLSEGGRG
jgi:hypothetical protein